MISLLVLALVAVVAQPAQSVDLVRYTNALTQYNGTNQDVGSIAIPGWPTDKQIGESLYKILVELREEQSEMSWGNINDPLRYESPTYDPTPKPITTFKTKCGRHGVGAISATETTIWYACYDDKSARIYRAEAI